MLLFFLNHFQYTQLLFLSSTYTAFGYFFIRTYHFQVLRIRFQSVSLYAATISKFCVYNFRLFRYTHWSFYCSAYAILSNFPTHETFIFLCRDFCSIFPYAVTIFNFAQVLLLYLSLHSDDFLLCVGIITSFLPTQQHFCTTHRYFCFVKNLRNSKNVYRATRQPLLILYRT